MFSLVIWIVFFIEIVFTGLVGYLVLLTIASLKAERLTKPTIDPSQRFAILIPAHNEERLLPGLLNNLAQIDYPKDLFEIHVVADNCVDGTASIAKNHANVHSRADTENPGKGPALNWLLSKILESKPSFDAIVILDADSIVSSGFLRIMAEHLNRGEHVIQAYYAVRDPGRSWIGAIRYAALSVLHYVRPQGRMMLGGSVGLKGNGMVFSTEVLRNYQWSASVTEDIEFHMALILNGERVTFAPDAVVFGEMPDTLQNSNSQHIRWEQGRLEMSRRYIPQLLKQSLTAGLAGNFKKSYLLFDAFMEFVIPPFAILFGLNVLLFFVNALILGLSKILDQKAIFSNGFDLPGLNMLISSFLLIGLVFYVIIGLQSVHAPKNVYLKLLYAPAYVFWKVFQYLQVLGNRGQQGWVRTTRNEG